MLQNILNLSKRYIYVLNAERFVIQNLFDLKSKDYSCIVTLSKSIVCI